jgi:hydrogenase maturation protease
VSASPRILVAGIGNIFLGDDAFGVEVARLLSARRQPEGVRVVDFGIRGLDLAYALTDDCDAAILVDAAPRGGTPGTLYLIEPSLDPGSFAASGGFDGHSMDPVKVLQLASTLGTLPPRVLIVGCEPASAATEDNEVFELSPAVQAALGPAVEMVESLIDRLRAEESGAPVEEMAK